MSIKKILLSGGRAPATLELARLLSSQGHHISVIESIPHHVCQRSRSIDHFLYAPSPRTNPKGFTTALIQYIQKEKIDVYIPTCEEIFTAAHEYDILSPLCQCWLEPIYRLDSLHNKWTFIQEAKGLAEKLPRTLYLTSWNEVETTLAQNRETDWILKPVYSRFSIQIQEILSGRNPHPVVISKNCPWILQEKISGRQICTYSVAYKGRLLLHSAYTAPYTAGKGAAILFAPYQNLSLQQRIENWIREKEWTGQISFDWIENEVGDIIPIECNPRLTSGVHLFSDADQIDVAFTVPEEVETVITPRNPQKRMLLLGMISYGLRSCKSLQERITWCKMMKTHQDVVFRWRDPYPIYSQLKSILYFWKQSRRKKITVLEASTEDIEWNGDHK